MVQMEKQNRMFQNSCLKLSGIIIYFMLISSCSARIDPSAANSSAANIAVIAEYLYAILSLVLFAVFAWVLPFIGALLIAVGISMYFELVTLPFNPLILISTGAILIITGRITPIKSYKPEIIISRIPTKNSDNVKPKVTLSLTSYFISLSITVIGGVLVLLIWHFMNIEK